MPLSAGFEVILSVDDDAGVLASAIVTAGATLSSVKVNDAVPVLPATSVSLATMVCAPCARPVGVNDQAPLALAVVVPSTVAPSVSVTTALASAVPLSAGFEVILSVDDEPVSLRQRHRHRRRHACPA